MNERISSLSRFYLTNQMLSYTLYDGFRPPLCVIGHYCYEWYDEGNLFYIGSGQNRRAWNTHSDEAEAIRRRSGCFRVKILRQFMSKTMAHHMERRLIEQALRNNVKLANQRVPNIS